MGSHAPITIASSWRLGVLASIGGGAFSDEPARFRPLVDELRHRDRFMVTADFEAYWEAQRCVELMWDDPGRWKRVTILNTARIGWFSSNRTIRGAGDLARAGELRRETVEGCCTQIGSL